MEKGQWVVRQHATRKQALDYGQVVNVGDARVKLQLYDTSGGYLGQPSWFPLEQTAHWRIFETRHDAMDIWARSRGISQGR